MNPGAIIFDFDGTIADTETADYRSWCEVLAPYGCDIPLEIWANYVGTADSDWRPYLHLEQHLGHTVDRDALKQTQRERYLRALVNLAPLPGIVDLIHDCHQLGIPMGVASSADRSWVRGHLTTLGLIDCVATIRCKEDVARTKPDPALYLLASADLGIDPHHAVAIEDSPNGATAVVAAGLTTVVIPNPVTAGYAFPPCTMLVSAVGLTVERLFALRSGRQALDVIN